MLEGCDFEHWLVVVEAPDPQLTRDDIIDGYIKTLAQIIGSEEEARMKIYSVSTRHYFAFGALVSEELSYKLKELPNVRWVLPDSYMDVKNKTYAGEPFINGQPVPYDPKYHAIWVQNHAESQRSRNRSSRRQKDPNSRSRQPTSSSVCDDSNQNWISTPNHLIPALQTSTTQNRTSQTLSLSDPGYYKQGQIHSADSVNEAVQSSQMQIPYHLRNQDQAPPTYTKKNAPPAYNQNQGPPTYSQNYTPPSCTQVQPPPTYSQNQAPPSYSQNQALPNYSQNQATPTYSQNQAPPTYSQNQERPNYSQNQAPLRDLTYSQNHAPPTYTQNQARPNYPQNQASLTYSQNQAPPTYSQNQLYPNYYQNQAPPTYSLSQAPPTYSQNQAPPTYSQNQAPPSYSQNQSHPNSSQNQSHPPYSQNQAPPTCFQNQARPNGYQNQAPPTYSQSMATQPPFMQNHPTPWTPPPTYSQDMATQHSGTMDPNSQGWGSRSHSWAPPGGSENQTHPPPTTPNNNFSYKNMPPSAPASNVPYQGQVWGPSSKYQSWPSQPQNSNNYSHGNFQPSAPARDMPSHLQNTNFHGGSMPSHAQQNENLYKDSPLHAQSTSTSNDYPSESLLQLQYQDSHRTYIDMQSSTSMVTPQSTQNFQNANVVPPALAQDMTSHTCNPNSSRQDAAAEVQQNGYSRNIPHHAKYSPYNTYENQQYQNSTRELQRSSATEIPQNWNHQSIPPSMQNSVSPDMLMSRGVLTHQNQDEDMSRVNQNSKSQHNMGSASQNNDHNGGRKMPNDTSMDTVQTRDYQERDNPADDY
uniref:MORF/ORRM1/DAG-like MORF domain-containing protein n=2 Tax=Chenopodium quinoa TaxID=63459 RepID=A0A803KRG4_CHEQI